jgi:hypothetical protein
VAVATAFFPGTAEVQFGQLLHSAQLLDSFVGDTTIFLVKYNLPMRRLANDLESQIPVDRLSPESQCCTDSFLSYGNVASRSPISTQSFERHPTKETAVTVETTIVKSEAATIRSLNSTDGDGKLSLQRSAELFPINK